MTRLEIIGALSNMALSFASVGVSADDFLSKFKSAAATPIHLRFTVRPIDVAVMCRQAAAPLSTKDDWYRWGEAATRYTNPHRRKVMPTLTKAMSSALHRVLHRGDPKSAAQFSNRLRVLEGDFYRHQHLMVDYKKLKPGSGKCDCVFAAVPNETLYEYLTRLRPPGDIVMENDGSGVLVKKVRYSDRDFAAFRRMQYEFDIPSKSMPALIAGMRHRFTRETASTASMVSTRTLVSRFARLRHKDKMLQRAEAELWVRRWPVVRSSTTTDCTYNLGEKFVQHDSYAPIGEYKKRTPKTIFIGIGPVAAKTGPICAAESVYRTLAIMGWLFLSVFGSGCVDHAALGEIPLKYKYASSAYVEVLPFPPYFPCTVPRNTFAAFCYACARVTVLLPLPFP